MKKITIVAPVYSEEGVIELFYSSLKDVLSKLNYHHEVIFVNDGSKDKSLEILKKIANEDSNVKIISFSRNFGHQVAISAGIEESSGDAIIVMDSDMQDPPEVISQMLIKWEDGYEVVYAKRIKRYGESFFKKNTAALFYRFINRLSDIQIPLDTGDFRLIDRKIQIQLSKFREKSRFIRGIISWIGYRQTYVEFDRQERFTGETKYPLWKMIKFALDGITSFSITPLKIALGIGLFSMITAFFVSCYVFYRYLFFRELILSGWASILLAVVFFGGIQLLTIGIIGEYIGRIFEETKDRPLYIIDEKINFD